MLRRVELKTVVKLLNELLDIDREAITRLFEHREPCVDLFVQHPKVVVKTIPGSSKPHVGVLGIINGFFREGHDHGPIAMRLRPDGQIGEFLLYSR